MRRTFGQGICGGLRPLFKRAWRRTYSGRHSKVSYRRLTFGLLKLRYVIVSIERRAEQILQLDIRGSEFVLPNSEGPDTSWTEIHSTDRMLIILIEGFKSGVADREWGPAPISHDVESHSEDDYVVYVTEYKKIICDILVTNKCFDYFRTRFGSSMSASSY